MTHPSPANAQKGALMTLPFTDPIPGTTLGEWIHGLAADGRPMHTAEVLHANADRYVQDLAASGLAHGVEGAQQRPVLDYSAPGRLEMWWLFNGEWIVLWAPDPPTPVSVVPKPPSVREMPAQPAPRTPVTPGVDAKRLIPGGRRRFGRRTNTPKGTR